jgi:DNA polymerase zeta
MENTHPGISRETCYEDHGLIHSAGISNGLNIITERQETDAVSRLIKLVHEWDPDILLGFEVQMLSWGYLIQRAGALGIDVASQLSRVQDTSGTARFDAEKDQWGASKTSEISISGRIVLNVWRLMRHEVGEAWYHTIRLYNSYLYSRFFSGYFECLLI